MDFIKNNVMKTLKIAIKILIYPILYLFLGLSYLIPRDKNVWIFGGFSSNSFNDNAKYLYLYTSTNCTKIKAVWISSNKNIIKFLRSKNLLAYYKLSFQGIFYSLVGQYYFFNNSLRDINLWTSGSATKINLWHGIPIKKIKFDINKPLYIPSVKNQFLHPDHYIKPNYVLSSSKKVSKFFCSAFRINEKSCLNFGYPRNEILLYSKNKIMDFVEKYEPFKTKSLIHKLKKYKKVFIYMPTWRDDGRDFIHNAKIDFDCLEHIMQKKNFLLILKLHHATKLSINVKQYKNILLIDNNLDVYPILPFTYCLITDYSSIYFDYKLMRKEVILFPFDKEEYLTKDREMYYSYDLVTENQLVANNFEELITLIQSDNIDISDNNLLQDMIFETKGVESSKEIVKIIKKENE